MLYPDALPLGARIDRYEIVQYLGHGGFGISYLVRDAELQMEFALKEYFPLGMVRRDGLAVRVVDRPNNKSTFEWGRRKFHEEARSLALFDHPNIVGVRRVFEANLTVFMVLDHPRGVTLEHWLRGLGRVPTKEELNAIAGRLLGAVECIHRNQILFLGISPDNIMIRSADDAPILVNFAAARFASEHASDHIPLLTFTAGYSAPEQYTSRAVRYGPWTDIYALGATLYRAISGVPPIEATMRQLKDDLKPATQQGEGRYRERFLAAIDAALELRPQMRPQRIAEWRLDLLEDVRAGP